MGYRDMSDILGTARICTRDPEYPPMAPWSASHEVL